MNLQIGNDWKVTTDPYNFILEKRTMAKTKDTQEVKETWKLIGYFPDLELTFKHILREGIRSIEALNLLEILAKIEEVETMIETAVKDLKPDQPHKPTHEELEQIFSEVET